MFRELLPSTPVILLGFFLIIMGCSGDDNGSPTQSQNHAPVIQSVTASPSTVIETDYHDMVNLTTLSCVATDQDGDSLAYSWSCPDGTFLEGIQFGSVVQMYFYHVTGTFMVTVMVSDGFEVVEDSVQVTVIPYYN